MSSEIWSGIIARALAEDGADMDVTTAACVPKGKTVSGRLIAKEDMVVCGLDVAETALGVSLTRFCSDGETVKKGELIAELSGDTRQILSRERVALNLLQRMTGIATLTREMTLKIAGTKARIIDTRKTAPGLRPLDKMAVRVGGGANHRFNLTDGVLIKDNHIAAADGITNAVRAARRSVPHTLKIEVECENIGQVREALAAGADIIMLDNMTVPQTREAVAFIAGRALTESSGNMGDSDHSLLAYAECGVDFISVGALTHSVRAADISLKLDLL